MKNILLLALLTASCAGRIETMRYTSATIPSWVLEEWSNAQEELLELGNLPEDPRRFGPYEWNWVQMEKPFTYTDMDTGERSRAGGLTLFVSKQILICCGNREIVRHEAFHAILWKMNDPRYELHYPELRRQ